MPDQNPNPGAEPVVLPDAEVEAAALWNEFEDADRGAQPPADAGAQGDAFTADDATGAESTATPAPAGKDGGDDAIWQDAPPEAREAYEKLQREKKQFEQETRSYEGRAAARQARIADLNEQITAMKNKPAADDGNPLEQLAADYPELHAPISKVLGDISSRQEQAEAAQLGRLEAERSEETRLYVAEVRKQTDTLKEEHPDYLDVVKNNVEAWKGWVEDQPKRIRDAVAMNAQDITDARAASEVMAAFKAFLNPPAQPDSKPNPIADRRQRQIGASSSPAKTGRQPVVAGIPEEGDPQAIWDAFDAEEARKQQR